MKIDIPNLPEYKASNININWKINVKIISRYGRKSNRYVLLDLKDGTMFKAILGLDKIGIVSSTKYIQKIYRNGKLQWEIAWILHK